MAEAIKRFPDCVPAGMREDAFAKLLLVDEYLGMDPGNIVSSVMTGSLRS